MYCQNCRGELLGPFCVYCGTRAQALPVQPAPQPVARGGGSGAKVLFSVLAVLSLAGAGALAWRWNSLKHGGDASASLASSASQIPVPSQAPDPSQAPNPGQTGSPSQARDPSSPEARCLLSAEEISKIVGHTFMGPTVTTTGQGDSSVCTYSPEGNPVTRLVIQINREGGRDFMRVTKQYSSDSHEVQGIGEEGIFTDFMNDLHFRKGDVYVWVVADSLEKAGLVKSARDLEVTIGKRIAAML